MILLLPKSKDQFQLLLFGICGRKKTTEFSSKQQDKCSTCCSNCKGCAINGCIMGKCTKNNGAFGANSRVGFGPQMFDELDIHCIDLKQVMCICYTEICRRFEQIGVLMYGEHIVHFFYNEQKARWKKKFILKKKNLKHYI